MGYNGAECLHTLEQTRKQLFHFPLPTEASNELMKFCRDNNYFLNVYLNGLLHGVDDMALRHLPDGYNYLNRAKYSFVPDYQQLLDTAPTKALIIARTLEEREKLHLDLYSRFGPEGHNLHIVRTKTSSLTSFIDVKGTYSNYSTRDRFGHSATTIT
jgi:hypothetical protein